MRFLQVDVLDLHGMQRPNAHAQVGTCEDDMCKRWAIVVLGTGADEALEERVCHELVSTDGLEVERSLVVSDVRGTVDSASRCQVGGITETDVEASSQDSRSGNRTHCCNE